ncbi:DinB family protein [Chloroflexota bacterium]
MESGEFISGLFTRISEVLETALDGLNEQEINMQPLPECNSIGWMAWHLTRVQDRFISMLSGNEQVWLTGKWYEKFGRDANPGEVGFGHTPEDLAGFKAPNAKVLLDYHLATLEETRKYASTLTSEELDRDIEDSRAPKVALRLTAFISDNFQHAGQIAYLRGWIKNKN